MTFKSVDAAHALISAWLDRLPDLVREKLEAIPVDIYELVPETHLLAGVSESCAGSYVQADGYDIGDGLPPGRIAIYLSNLKGRHADELLVTYWHEAGHALGLSEEEVEELGLGHRGEVAAAP